jgi:hypothetical protein
MKLIAIVAGCILAALWFSVPQPQAHHAFAAEFDINKVMTLEGTVVKMEWVNPHAWLTINVTNAEGKVEEWALEFGPPNLLFRKGYRRNSLLPDMKVKVTGFGSADNQRILNVDTVTPRPRMCRRRRQTGSPTCRGSGRRSILPT